MSLEPVAARKLRRVSRGLTVFTYAILTVLLLGTIGLAVGYARSDSRADSFAAASACTAGGGNCAQRVQELPVQVVDAGVKSGKSSTYWLEVAGTSVPDQTVDLGCTNSSSFFLTAQGNGQLSAEVWDGQVIDFTYDGTKSCGVADSPTSEATIWLVFLGIFGSLSLGWLALMARGRFAVSRRSKILSGAAVAPLYLNVVIFPVLIGVLGSRSLWAYLLAYAIGVVLETPFVIRNALRPVDPRTGRAVSRTPKRYTPVGTSNTMSAARTRDRGRITLYVVTGLCLLGTAIMLAFYIPAQSNAFAYENAATCQGAATSGCVDQVTATIVDDGTYETDSGGANWIEISGPGISDLQFTLGGDNSYGMDGLQTGTKVTALLWRGKVIEVEYQGFTSPAPSTPAKSAADLLAGVYALGGVTVFFVLIRIAAVRVDRRVLSRLCGIVAIAALFGGIFAFIPLSVEARPVWWAFPLTFGICALIVTPIYTLAAASIRRKARRRGDVRYLGSDRAASRNR